MSLRPIRLLNPIGPSIRTIFPATLLQGIEVLHPYDAGTPFRSKNMHGDSNFEAKPEAKKHGQFAGLCRKS